MILLKTCTELSFSAGRRRGSARRPRAAVAAAALEAATEVPRRRRSCPARRSAARAPMLAANVRWPRHSVTLKTLRRGSLDAAALNGAVSARISGLRQRTHVHYSATRACEDVQSHAAPVDLTFRMASGHSGTNQSASIVGTVYECWNTVLKTVTRS